MTVTATFVAVNIIKLATAGTVTMAVIIGVKVFNTYEFTTKKKGGSKNDKSDELTPLRKRVRQ